MRFYHGTSIHFLEAIKRDGLKSPYLTDSLEVARYYASVVAENTNSKPLILEIEVQEDLLLYDRAAMDEPVLSSEKSRDRALEQAQLEHPEWVKDGFLIVPGNAWDISLKGAHSVRAKGLIPHSKIRIIES